MNGLAIESLLDASLVSEAGIRHVNFFNGRLLTASDLQAEQAAERSGRQQLGRALGAGVVHGLEVSLVRDGSNGQAPVLALTGGLALTRYGQAVELPISRVQLTLARRLPALPVDVGLFQDCVLPPSSAAAGRRAYLLTMAGASEFREQAPMVPVGGNGTASGCGDRYAVEGVLFRLVEMKESAFPGASQATRNLLASLMADAELQTLPATIRRARLSRLRNTLAHACFGTEELAAFREDPWRRPDGRSPYQSYGALDAMRADKSLTDCDVPLALVYWSESGVKFVDAWAARRRPVPSSPTSIWPSPAGARAAAEGEAILQQFQEQIESLIGAGPNQQALSSIRASDYFSFLPAAGLLPGAGGSRPGLDLDNFLIDLPHRPAEYLDDRRLPSLLAESILYPPINPSEGELAWLYRPWQNDRAANADPKIQPYAVFTSGHMPPAAVARFDLARWDFSNYAQ